MVEVRIRDNGIGIAPDMLPRIFDLFTQVDSTPGRSQGGLGIGLTLVRTLVEMHGGTVEAHSAGAGQGSEFVIRLPALGDVVGEVVDRPPLDWPVSPGDKGVARRILVVDDNADSRQSLTEILEEWGHEVRAAQDGETALDMARQFRPQVMLVDIGLPGMNGYDLARALRRTPGLDQAMLVAVTGYGRDEDRRASFDAGFDDHWVKPINLDALLTVASPSPPPPAQS